VNDFSKSVTRKEALTNLLVLPALASALAVGATTIARADSRTQLKYQSTPKGNQKCSGCSLFAPGKTATANGTCKVISGPISPNGWCTAFSPRPK
jgi:hypothetical protein